MRVLIAAIHPDEWNSYIPFDGYIKTIKHNYNYIVGVVAEYPAILISEADEYYTISNDKMIRSRSYPYVLDTDIRRNNEFVNTCVSQAVNDFKNHNLDIIYWQNTDNHTGVLDKEIIRSNTNDYRMSFYYAQQWYKSNSLICPTIKTFNNIKQKYSKLFDDKTFIITTRNYSFKSSSWNTAVLPCFYELLEFLTNNNIKIINIGFPPVHCNFTSNYCEINEQLTQDELVSLFYLAQGVLLQACSTGFLAHYASNVDSFILTEQWLDTIMSMIYKKNMMSYHTNLKMLKPSDLKNT